MEFIDGGVTAPKGWTANGILCKIKASRTTPDVALIYSEKVCSAAGLFTQNRVQAECVKLSKSHISKGTAQAIIANSGNANACTGREGYENAQKTALAVAQKLGLQTEDVLVCSTGVIGQQLPLTKITDNLDELVRGLSREGHATARQAIMTTDTQYKECAVRFEIDGLPVTIGAMSKGSGMIHINLGTMLSFITTDCNISSAMLQKAINDVTLKTFNCVSVDGDTSTNDTLLILANGLAENSLIETEGKKYDLFKEALEVLCKKMAKKLAADGEGATRLIECNVTGAINDECARKLAKEIISSNLVKAAMYGCDANWGRILCAMGYSGAMFSPEKTSVMFISAKGDKRYGELADIKDEMGTSCITCPNDCVGTMGNLSKIMVFQNGVPLDFDETLAKQILSEEVVYINVMLGDGEGVGTAWGCDLTYDYVKINGDYRT